MNTHKKGPKEERHTEKSEQEKVPFNIYRSLSAEFFGTFFLVFIDCGIVIIGDITGHKPSHFITAVSPALLVATMIYSIGHVSGAHINPTVTLAFALRRVFSWKCVPLYWASQIGGAIAAALILKAIFGDHKELGTCHPHYGDFSVFILEIILSCLLVTVILGTSTKHQTIGSEAAVAVAAIISVCGLIGKPISDVSMNPARSFAPALVSGSWDHLWIYAFAPIIGGMVAVLFTWVLHGPVKKEEMDAASGDGE